MAKVSPIQTSFNTGEVSPLLKGRVDFEKYKSGLGLCLNHIPQVQGGVTRRPGTKFVAEVKDSTKAGRLIRFQFSTAQAYVIEFGDTVARFYKNDGRIESPPGTPIELTGMPYRTADLEAIVVTQSADTLYIAHPSYPPATITRQSDTNWTYTVLTFTDGPYLDTNITTTTLTFSGGNKGTGVTCTASAITGINNGTGFQTTDVGRHIRAQLPGCAWGWALITARADTTHVTVTIVQTMGIQVIGGTINTNDTVSVDNIAGIAQGMVPTGTDIPGATHVVAVNPASFKMNNTATGTDSGIHIELVGTNLTTDVWALGMWSDTTGYPACVGFYQDRLVWGGATASPETVTASVTGNYLSHQPTDYDVAGTVIDSYGLNFTLASSDVQTIRWISGDANGMLLGTPSGEWAVSPGSQGGALTPTNINAVQMTAYGSAPIPPTRIGYTTLTVQRSLRKIRELTFTFYENRYHAPDMTVLAQHITLGGIKETAYQQEPNSILWCVRNDGTLLGFTYERDQNILAWHQHVLGGVSDVNGTQAIVESVATIPSQDGTRDEVWVIVNRLINGATKRYVEYMTKIWERGDSVLTACYSDCALSYSGAPTNTFTGATQLENQTVDVWADGSYHPPVVVSNSGGFTLTRNASNVTVGLHYNSDGQTLRNDSGASDGTAQGKTQRKHRVAFRLHDASSFLAGSDFSSMSRRNLTLDVDDNADSAPPLFTGDDTDTWEGDYSLEDLICWRFDQPGPGTLLAIMPQQHTMDR